IAFSASLFTCLFNAPATPQIYTLSLHDALPISVLVDVASTRPGVSVTSQRSNWPQNISCVRSVWSCIICQRQLPLVANSAVRPRSEEHTSELQSRFDLVCRLLLEKKKKIKNRTR